MDLEEGPLGTPVVIRLPHYLIGLPATGISLWRVLIPKDGIHILKLYTLRLGIYEIYYAGIST